MKTRATIDVKCAGCRAIRTVRRDHARRSSVNYCGKQCMARPVEERFWSHVDFDGPNGCWLWAAQIDRDGYGRFRPGGADSVSAPAHRVAFALWYGYWPPEHTDHIVCDNPPCVNPMHLRSATARENVQRARARQRMVA